MVKISCEYLIFPQTSANQYYRHSHRKQKQACKTYCHKLFFPFLINQEKSIKSFLLTIT